MSLKRAIRTRRLICEQLETRTVLSGLVGSEAVVDYAPAEGPFQAVIVAGESPDSPSLRVDSNSDQSVFDGVGSLTIATRRGNYICTGTPIDATHVVTAGHCVDLNNDGVSNKRDGINSITFNLNYGGNYSSKIIASSWITHPDFTGFNKPSIHDDVAVLTLSSSLPAGVPTYGLFTGNLLGQTITLVGYGQSGDGIKGYTVDASYTVKRDGQNVVDAFYSQDDSNRTTTNEVFRFDFDRADGTTGPLGGVSRGNLLETTLGGGDSGGPSFYFDGSNYLLAGVNTFSQSTPTISAPKFGSMGGGMSIPAYASWINQVVSGTASPGSGAVGNGRGPAGDSAIDAILFAMVDSAEAVSVTSVAVQNAPSGVSLVSTATAGNQSVTVPLATVDLDSIRENPVPQRTRTPRKELVLDEATESEMLTAVDLYYAISSESDR